MLAAVMSWRLPAQSSGSFARERVVIRNADGLRDTTYSQGPTLPPVT